MGILMKRLLLSLCLLAALARAEDPVLLEAQVRMIPKIMALDTRIASRTPNGRAVLAIVYDHKKATAQKFADTINRLYGGRVASLNFTALPLSSEEIAEHPEIAFAYLTPMSVSAVRRVAQWGQSQSVPVFSYDAGNLDNGILGAVAIERSTVIYLNRNVMRNGRFIFDDSLLQIARYVE